MKYVYVKDSEGFVSKKETSKVCDDEVVISKDEFERLSGDSFYKEKFQHGGRRDGAGRKSKFGKPLLYQIRVTEEEKQFIAFAREEHFDYWAAMHKAQCGGLKDWEDS